MSLATSSLVYPSLTRRVGKNPSNSLAASNPNSQNRNFKERKRGMPLRKKGWDRGPNPCTSNIWLGITSHRPNYHVNSTPAVKPW
jgi:hypothetical protein